MPRKDQRISVESCCLQGKTGWSLRGLPLLDNLWKNILSGIEAVFKLLPLEREVAGHWQWKKYFTWCVQLLASDYSWMFLSPSSLHVFAEKPPWNWTFNSDTLTDRGNSSITHWHLPCQNVDPKLERYEQTKVSYPKGGFYRKLQKNGDCMATT